MITNALIKILNELLQININRIEYYKHLLNEAKDMELDVKAIFQRMIEESIKYKQELNEKINQLGGTPETGAAASGNIYKKWADGKTAVISGYKKTILEACEYDEEAVQNAYRAALSSDATMDADVLEIIKKQLQNFKD